MFKIEKKMLIRISIFLLLCTVAFIFIDGNLGGFNLFKAQNYEFYFQSWVSMAGIVFTLSMAVTTYILYRKSKFSSLKYLSISFVLTSVAYLIIGYHASYCKVCSDLALCSASHNYSNYFTVIALIVFVVMVLLIKARGNIALLKIFSWGLILSSVFLVIILFASIQFMEIPGLTFYEFGTINLQGFIFIFPLVLIALSLLYFRCYSKLAKVVLFIFLLLFMSFLPQAYHLFICQDCHSLECSEFYATSGLFMFMAVGILIYSIDLQLEEKSD